MKTARDFWKWVKDDNLKLQHEFIPVDYGDEYYSESGEICRVWFKDKTVIEFGFVSITEWEDDWAEPDEQTVFKCYDGTDPDSKEYMKTIKWQDVYNKINQS